MAPNVPCGQSVHDVALPRLYVPAPHIDAVEEIEPARHAKPAAAVQLSLQAAVESPVVAPYRPPGQSVQAKTPAPPGLYDPAAQIEPNKTLKPAVHAKPGAAMHGPLQSVPVNPVVFPNRPALQPLQASMNIPPALHCPASHIVPAELVVPAVQARPGATVSHMPLQYDSVCPAVAP